MFTRTHIRTAVAALGLVSMGLVATACGDDEADAQITAAEVASTTTVEPAVTAPADADHTEHSAPPATEPPATAPETTVAAGQVVEVHTADYGFGGIPATVAPGTAFDLVNDSSAEVHEMVAVRLADTETRSVHEIVQAQDFGALFSSGAPALVIVAGPNGGEPIVAEGDGTLSEPGRYAVVCFIPTGADPQEYLEAAATSDGPPQVEGGAPHVAHGMYAELTVA